RQTDRLLHATQLKEYDGVHVKQLRRSAEALLHRRSGARSILEAPLVGQGTEPENGAPFIQLASAERLLGMLPHDAVLTGDIRVENAVRGYRYGHGRGFRSGIGDRLGKGCGAVMRYVRLDGRGRLRLRV